MRLFDKIRLSSRDPSASTFFWRLPVRFAFWALGPRQLSATLWRRGFTTGISVWLVR